MKVIDLLNKIANKEEVPKEIYFNGLKWNYDIDNNLYRNGSSSLLSILGGYKGIILNDEIKILEESKEEKKIPEKLDWNKNDFTYPEGNLMSEETADMLMEIQDKINKIIDILNKGENK